MSIADSIQFLRSYKHQVRRFISLSVALGSLNGMLLIVQAWCLAHVIDAAIFRQQGLADVLPWLLAIPALLIFRSLCVFLAEKFSFEAAAQIKQQLRTQLYQKLRQTGPIALGAEQSGELATSITDGVDALEAYYARYLPAMSLAVYIPLAILIFVLPVDWQSAVVLLITAPLIPFFMILIGKGAEKLNQQQWQQLQRMGGRFLDAIHGLTTLKLFNASRREARLISQMSEQYRLMTMKVLRLAFLSALALEFFATVSIAIVAVLIGFRLLFAEIDFHSAFFVLLLAPEFYLPLRALGTHYHARLNAIAATEKILSLLHNQSSMIAGKAILQNSDSISIEFHNVTFSYQPDQAVIKGLTFSLQAGQTLALVGPSGAGKTTIAHLIMGFCTPDEGNILVNGQDLAELDRQRWHQQLSWVPQNSKLLHASVVENIALGDNNINHERLIEACRQANALEFIEQLNDGFDTLLGETGRQLSGGQQQRLLMARAFYRNSRLLILDEATASLDSHNEQIISEAIERLSQDRTTLIIAHRLATVRKADRILVIQDGQIVESGNHQTLLEQQGVYWQMLQHSQGLSP